MKKSIALKIFGIIIFGCIAMAVTELILKPTYIIKSIIKIICFLVIPLIVLHKDKILSMKIIMPDKKNFRKSISLGIILYLFIVGLFFLLNNSDLYNFDFSAITSKLGENLGILKSNFIFVALYISFCNSLLEEFFFRGIAFILMSDFIGTKYAYIFSSVTFALYHVAIMDGWFSPVIFVSAVIALAVGGCIFNYIDEKNKNIFNSWIVHMFANFAINTIGFIIFTYYH